MTNVPEERAKWLAVLRDGDRGKVVIAKRSLVRLAKVEINQARMYARAQAKKRILAYRESQKAASA